MKFEPVLRLCTRLECAAQSRNAGSNFISNSTTAAETGQNLVKDTKVKDTKGTIIPTQAAAKLLAVDSPKLPLTVPHHAETFRMAAIRSQS